MTILRSGSNFHVSRLSVTAVSSFDGSLPHVLCQNGRSVGLIAIRSGKIVEKICHRGGQVNPAVMVFSPFSSISVFMKRSGQYHLFRFIYSDSNDIVDSADCAHSSRLL